MCQGCHNFSVCPITAHYILSMYKILTHYCVIAFQTHRVTPFVGRNKQIIRKLFKVCSIMTQKQAHYKQWISLKFLSLAPESVRALTRTFLRHALAVENEIVLIRWFIDLCDTAFLRRRARFSATLANRRTA